ncbi:MAG: radical SAM protein [Bacteroides sp.]|nr:radical SAM protein [Bacteroides sp.]
MSEHTDIIYNAATEQFVIVPYTFDFDNLNLSSELAAKLTREGMFVDDRIDESKESWDQYLKSVRDDSLFRLIINPTLNCNFRCWYCYETHRKDSTMSAEVLQKTKDFIKQIISKYKKIELSFFGGEPILEFETIVLPLIRYTDALSKKFGKEYVITFTTNGFLISDKMIESLKPYNIGICQITLDGGPESHNNTRVSRHQDSFIKISDNIKLLAKAQIPVLIRVNVTNENIEEASVVPSYFSDLPAEVTHYLRVFVQQVWQDAHNEILDKRLKLYEKFIQVGIYPWKRRFNYTKDICYGDSLHSCVINYDGKIFKCTAMDFENVQNEATIFDNPLQEFQDSFLSYISKKIQNLRCKDCRILPLVAEAVLNTLVRPITEATVCMRVRKIKTS